MKPLIVLGLLSVALTGCGGGMNSCKPAGFAMLVQPSDPLAAPDHHALPPGNQELFLAGLGSEFGPHCPSTNLFQLTHAQWKTSDPENVAISSADDATNGLATCLGTTASGASVSATLTADGFTQTVSTPITCK